MIKELSLEQREELINVFILNFIQKNRRERCHFEFADAKRRSKFTDRLNHKWSSVFDMRFLTELEKKHDDYGEIRHLLDLKDDELCYVISDHEEYDDKFLPFKEAFELIGYVSFATIIINMAANKVYFVTERARNWPRFIGKR